MEICRKDAADTGEEVGVVNRPTFSTKLPLPVLLMLRDCISPGGPCGNTALFCGEDVKPPGGVSIAVWAKEACRLAFSAAGRNPIAIGNLGMANETDVVVEGEPITVLA